MCNTTNLKFKPFIIEVFENGKVSIPAFVNSPDQQLTIEELKRCRDYIDLIIANPDNFHVVKPVDPNLWHPSNGGGIMAGLAGVSALPLKTMAYCDTCGLSGQPQDATSSMCHACEKKQLLNQVNPPFDEAKFFEKHVEKWVSDGAEIGMSQPVGISKDMVSTPSQSVKGGICNYVGCHKPATHCKNTYCFEHNNIVNL